MLRINEKMQKYLSNIHATNEVVKKENEAIFNKETLPDFNLRVKNENYYALDIYGLLVRKNDFNVAKSPFGWIKSGDDEKIVNIHVLDNIVGDEEDVREQTLRYMHLRFATLFKQPRSVLSRFYAEKKEE